MKKIILGVTAFTMMLSANNTAVLNINETDLEVGVKIRMIVDLADEQVSERRSDIGIKIVKADKENSSSSLGEDLGYYGEVNWVVSQNIGNDGLRLGIGAKLNMAEDFITMPWGIEATYDMNAILKYPVSFTASAYYAPPVLSFVDAESYLEKRIEVETNVIDDVSLVLGYRNMETNYVNSLNMGTADFTYNEAAYFGVKMNF